MLAGWLRPSRILVRHVEPISGLLECGDSMNIQQREYAASLAYRVPEPSRISRTCGRRFSPL